jgi:hypothetical protein
VCSSMQQITDDGPPAATNRNQFQLIQPAMHTNDGARKWPTVGLESKRPLLQSSASYDSYLSTDLTCSRKTDWSTKGR